MEKMMGILFSDKPLRWKTDSRASRLLTVVDERGRWFVLSSTSRNWKSNLGFSWFLQMGDSKICKIIRSCSTLVGFNRNITGVWLPEFIETHQ